MVTPPGVGALRKRRTLHLGSGGTVYTCLKIYVILSKFIIKVEVCYLLKCFLPVVNDLMLHLVRLSPLLYLYYIFLLQLQAEEDHEAPANPKTDNSLHLFFSGSRNMTNFWVKLLTFFSYFYYLWKNLKQF